MNFAAGNRRPFSYMGMKLAVLLLGYAMPSRCLSPRAGFSCSARSPRVRRRHGQFSTSPDLPRLDKISRALSTPIAHDGAPATREAPVDSAAGEFFEIGRVSNRRLEWDEARGRWVTHGLSELEESELLDSDGNRVSRDGSVLSNLIRHTFIPDSVSEDYFSYAKWKLFQRFVSSTVNVFGVQAMLLALGVRTEGALGMAAATSWVLKDALGKMGRIMWAGRMGRQFDADAKRWRFRSSIMYALGNGLEIVTYIFPACFILLASSANLLKQMSMLTSSATRNSIYRSFAAQRNNIGEISAKSEAQIAVVDLLGMVWGIYVSRAVGTEPLNIIVAYLLLSGVDMFAIYNEIRSVVFRDLNHERLCLALDDYVESACVRTGSEAPTNQPPVTPRFRVPALGCPAAEWVPHGPALVAKREHIFRPPDTRKEGVFGTLSLLEGHRYGPVLLRECLSDVFRCERYAVLLLDKPSGGGGVEPMVLLHHDAKSPDTAKALLVYFTLKRLLRELSSSPDARNQLGSGTGQRLSDGEVVALLRAAQGGASERYADFAGKMTAAGWSTERFWLPMAMRTYWEIAEGPPAARVGGVRKSSDSSRKESPH